MCHLIFDVKMDLTRTSRYVKCGHLTDYPSCKAYANVGMLDSVKVDVLVISFNNTDILAKEINYTHLNVETKDKSFLYSVYEFVSD